MTHPGTGGEPGEKLGAENWLGQDDLPWNILLVASLDDVPEPSLLLERLSTLSAENLWAAPSKDAVVKGEVDGLMASLSGLTDAGPPVSVGRTPTGLVVRAHHAYVDGLGLLAVLGALTGLDIVSGAAGIGERPRRSVAATLPSRLLEVALRPPARVAGSPEVAPTGVKSDVFAVATVAHPVRTVDLAHAAVQAVAAMNAGAGARADRIALAVGVSTLGGADLRVGDHSGFLRFTHAERYTLAELDWALAAGPLQVGGTAQGGAARRTSGLIRWASRTFAARLGSTLLISHLGRIEAAGLHRADFYPLAGGGSGICVGAATTGDTTTVTIRGRGRQHSTAGLESLLADVVDRLG